MKMCTAPESKILYIIQAQKSQNVLGSDQEPTLSDHHWLFDNDHCQICAAMELWTNLSVTMDDFVYSYCRTKLSMRCAEKISIRSESALLWVETSSPERWKRYFDFILTWNGLISLNLAKAGRYVLIHPEKPFLKSRAILDFTLRSRNLHSIKKIFCVWENFWFKTSPLFRLKNNALHVFGHKIFTWIESTVFERSHFSGSRLKSLSRSTILYQLCVASSENVLDVFGQISYLKEVE